jgi:hypothetical protein
MFSNLFEDRKHQPENVEIGPSDISIDLLRAVYRANHLPLHTRMRAAMAALKHEVPALMATSIVSEGGFAELLDRRLARINEMKLLENKTINSEKVIAEPTIDPPPTPTPPLPAPLSRLYSNRFRRRF